MRELTAAIRGSLVAVAGEDLVQLWDSASGEKVSEFEAAYEWGGFRLALDPTGSLCAVACFDAGRRGGVTCYEVSSAKIIWHRGIGGTQHLRFASDGKSVCCGREKRPLLRLCSASGETVEELRDIADVQDSPYSAHSLFVPCSSDYVLQGTRRCNFERNRYLSSCGHERTGFPTAIGFGPEDVWLAEAGLEPMLRCFGYNGVEKWQVAMPASTIVCQLCYRPADGHFYGTEYNRETGCDGKLVRYSDTGDREEVSAIFPMWTHLGFCRNGDTLVTPNGDVIETTRGAIINRIGSR